MVKIIRKVAVEFSREVEIIGGGGKLFLGGGGLNILGSKWNYFRGAEFFSWELQFFLGDFFCGWLCFLTKIYHDNTLNYHFLMTKLYQKYILQNAL